MKLTMFSLNLMHILIGTSIALSFSYISHVVCLIQIQRLHI